jgi:Zn-dependent protease with chaperone function
VSFALLGGALALGTFAVVASLLSLVSVTAWRAQLARRGAEPFDAAPRARALFLLRLLPTLGALVAVFAFVVPAFLLFEPHDADEPVEGPLALLAGAGALLIASGAARALLAWRATRRLARAWHRRAEPLDLPDAPAPAYVFEHAFPAVTLLGVRRPRLFVARKVLDALEPDELRAVLAHEAGHLAAGDNLRALLARACPDPLALLPVGARLTRAFMRAVEAAADDHAAGADPARALDLASALVKLGRLAPVGARLARPLGAAVGAGITDGDSDGLAERIERLLARADGRARSIAARTQPARAAVRPAPTLGPSAMAALSAAAVAALVTHADVLRAVHHALEHAVNFLR